MFVSCTWTVLYANCSQVCLRSFADSTRIRSSDIFLIPTKRKRLWPAAVPGMFPDASRTVLYVNCFQRSLSCARDPQDSLKSESWLSLPSNIPSNEHSFKMSSNMFTFSSPQAPETPNKRAFASPGKSRLPIPVSINCGITSVQASCPQTPSKIPLLAKSLRNLSLVAEDKPATTTKPRWEAPKRKPKEKKIWAGAPRVGVASTPKETQTSSRADVMPPPTPLPRKQIPLYGKARSLPMLPVPATPCSSPRRMSFRDSTIQFTYRNPANKGPVFASPERPRIDYDSIPKAEIKVNGMKRSVGYDERFPILKRVKKNKVQDIVEI